MSLRIDIVTIFPEFFRSPLGESLIQKAQDKGLVEIAVHDLRDYTHDRHRTVDDKPFGGGAGMVIKPEPVFECLDKIRQKGWVVVMSPHGAPFRQERAEELTQKKHIVLLAGHYEGLDYRIHEQLADEEISIGDFITMGGEAPALCVLESVIRLLPGVLGNSESIKDESFHGERLEYPQYTRPRDFRGWKVPEVLVSGNHKEVDAWRQEQSLKLTREKRPDMLRSKK